MDAWDFSIWTTMAVDTQQIWVRSTNPGRDRVQIILMGYEIRVRCMFEWDLHRSKCREHTGNGAHVWSQQPTDFFLPPSPSLYYSFYLSLVISCVPQCMLEPFCCLCDCILRLQAVSRVPLVLSFSFPTVSCFWPLPAWIRYENKFSSEGHIFMCFDPSWLGWTLVKNLSLTGWCSLVRTDV